MTIVYSPHWLFYDSHWKVTPSGMHRVFRTFRTQPIGASDCIWIVPGTHEED